MGVKKRNNTAEHMLKEVKRNAVSVHSRRGFSTIHLQV